MAMGMAPTPSRPWWIGPPATDLTRRETPRVPVRASVTYAQGQQRGEGTTINVGLRGLAVEVDDSALPAVGEEVVVVLRLRPDQPLPFNGIVSWCGEHSFGVHYGPIGRLQTWMLVRVLGGRDGPG